jgi:YVTN family beta-propeller protein
MGLERIRRLLGGLSVGFLALASLAVVLDNPPPEQMLVGTRYGNQVLVPSNQLLNPAGERIEFSSRPIDLALSPDGTTLAVLLPGGIQIRSATGALIRTIVMRTASFMGVAFTPGGEWVVASQVASGGSVAIGDVPQRCGVAYMSVPANSVPAGLAFDRTGANLYVALSRLNAVGRLDIEAGRVLETVDVGVAPLGVAITPAGDRLFVANWGGRRPAPGEPAADSSGSPALVDERGIAASGTVSVIELPAFRAIAEIPVGLHPSAVAIVSDGTLAAVANANSDSVTLIDTSSLRVVDTVSLPAMPYGYLGSSPTALAFSPSGNRLYVACGGNNAVGVLERQGSSYGFRGFIPADWYPVALAVADDGSGGDRVYVANSKGIGSRNATSRFTVGQARGSLTILSGSALDGASGDAAAFSNDPFRNAAAPADSPRNLADLGIQHVFLIIKENRTYDQVLGDLDRGNNDPSLTMYGWEVTPNQHQMARQFVTLDNFYASGVVSADGHQWITQAMATDYVERAHAGWPRSYPFTGDDPLAFASTGFLWNNAQRAGLSARVFGEFTAPVSGSGGRWVDFYRDSQSSEMKLNPVNESKVTALNAVVDRRFPGWGLQIPDQWRARMFLRALDEFRAQGWLPNLTIVYLPSDHTNGVSPNYPTPRAMVADNDLATGRVVEAITQSPWWPRSAIFITEDDAQDGVDHVDGHRTLCLVISPYARRGAVDSTHYNQTSVVRTIEELLGLPPMNKFDAAALPMRSVFSTRPDLGTFQPVPNRIALDEMNVSPAGLTGAARQAVLDSMGMDFSGPDRAPEETLNRILWHMARGFNTPYPRVPHAPWCRPDPD